jgi:GMP synthase (glutamine-hydrolysing)
MILLINICKEKLHYYEFVRPIEDVLKMNKIDFFTLNYNEILQGDLDKAEKIIICGTSLKDNGFIENIDNFRWIRDFSKPILGICGGMQIIGLIFSGKIKKKTEVGFFIEKFSNFLGLNGEKEVYHLHNNYISLPENFEQFSSSDISQAIKHKTKDIYGVLFHPEVRQKDLIIRFCELI